MTMKNCTLITGGAGFIGCALSKQSSRFSAPVVVIDHLHPQVHHRRARPAQLAASTELVQADICLRDTWDTFLSEYRPVDVIHLAAETGTGQSLTESVRHAEVNVVGTAQMLDAFSRHAVVPKRIVLTSSRAVYGEGAWRSAGGEIAYPGQRSAKMLDRGEWDFPSMNALPFDASITAPNPANIYGATKLTQEQIIAAWCNSYSVEYVILRLQNVYGPGQSLSNPYTGIVPFFSRIARDGGSIPLYEDGAMLRDFVYIEDVASAIMCALQSDASVSKKMDIGFGRSISIGQLARIIACHYGAPEPYVSGQYRNGDIRHAACNPGDAMRWLDWRPETSPEEGIPKLCEWIDRVERDGGLS